MMISFTLWCLTSVFVSCTTSPQIRSARYLAAGKKLLQSQDPGRALLQFQNCSSGDATEIRKCTTS